MGENNVTKISLSTFFLLLAIIAIIVLGVFVYKLNNDKKIEKEKTTELQAQVNDLNDTISNLQERINNISENINTNTESNNLPITDETEKNNYDEIILDGNYIEGDAGDEVWIFSADNKVSFSSVISNYKGSYKTIDKNTIEVHFTEEERDDLDNPPQKNTYTIDEYYKILVNDDNNTIIILDTNQELHKSASN